jgi:hypothetical protein
MCVRERKQQVHNTKTRTRDYVAQAAAEASWSLQSRVMDTVSYLQRLGWMGLLLLGRLSFSVGYIVGAILGCCAPK